MRSWIWTVRALAVGLVFWGVAGKAADVPARLWEYFGMSDASGAVPIGTNGFAVADDENNAIRIYDRDHGGPPRQVIDMEALLGVDKNKPEMDLEAAALINHRAFWLGSHSRNWDGKRRVSRETIFATDITVRNGWVELTLVGQPYHHLVADLVNSPALTGLGLAVASRRPPKAEGALNLEGLCATPEGQLLIGFRNPLPRGKALVVPLKNPQEIMRGTMAQLGDPWLLDLGGLGVRDMALVQGVYFIVAGSYKEGGASRLYRWAGGAARPMRVESIKFKHFNAEAILAYPDKGVAELQFLSDDGTRLNGERINKELPVTQRRFRSIWLTIPAPGG